MMNPWTSRALRSAAALLAAAIVAGVAGCASAPVAPPAPTFTYEQKLAWILQLEDQRMLRLPQPPPVAPPVTSGRRAAPPPPPPTSAPDLVVLVKDTDARVRRRAALALGRVKLGAGVAPLTATLADSDADVRAMAAFALGLIGDSSAEAPLTPLLTDTSLLVRGRAAEALGSIGAKGAAAAIGTMVGELVRSAPVAAMQPDDEAWPAAPEAEACKLGLFALVRLRAFDPIAAAVLENGRPVSAWWPVAYALQRVDDKRAAPALTELLKNRGRYTRAFAARGLGVLRDVSAGPALAALLDPAIKSGIEVSAQAIRAIGQINYGDGAAALIKIAADTTSHPNLRLEAVNALGTLRSTEALPLLYELMTESWAAMRSASMQAAARADPDAFILVLASMEPDRDWRVRSALATVLGTLPPEIGLDRLRAMFGDEDKRVRPAVMAALARLKAPDLATLLLEQLQDPDFGVRAAAARQVAQLKPEGAADALRAAYKTAQPDSAIDARAAALDGLAELGAAEATETLRAALADKDWAIRIRATQLLARLESGSADGATVSAELEDAIRPVPAAPTAPYDDPQLIAPEFSPHVFIETAYGTIEFELTVLDAPQTTRNFMELARKGFFNGLEVHRVVPNFVVQDGDPRGDGQGGPGYTIRDELNDRPYLRGTVGMALSWADTGGSQFFITHSPQPHLDGRYTAFGRVVNGMDVVDQMKAGDVIQRVRVWDGKGWQ